MSPLDPSLLFAAGVALDLIHDALERKLPKEEAAGFWVEWLAWAILLAVYWTLPFIHRYATSSILGAELEEAAVSEKRSECRGDAWVAYALSFCLVGAGFLWQSENERYNWALPLITTSVLLFVLACRRLYPDRSDHWHLPLASSGRPGWALLGTVLAGSMGSIVSSILVRFHTSPDSSRITALSSCMLLLQCLLYCALGQVKLAMLCESQSTSVLRDNLLRKVSIYAFALWTLLLAVSHTQNLSVYPTFLIMGMTRAFHYFVLFTLSLRYSQLTIVSATTLPTIIMSIGQTLRATSFNAGAASALVALAALAQCVMCLPSSAASRKFLFLLLLLPGSIMFHRHTSMASWSARLSQTLAAPGLHPIENLAAIGQAQFSHFLTSQSNTLEIAVAEYIRRYRRNPPPKFDKWFAIAESEDYVLFDEFDTMMETLEPFWGVSASELRSRVGATFKDPRLIRFNISNAVLSFDHEGWAPWIGEQVQSWLPPEWRVILPNMTFAVNVLDEPRVLAPYDTLSTALHQASTNSSSDRKSDLPEKQVSKRTEVDFLKVGRQKAWQAMTSACTLESSARNDGFVKARSRLPTFVANATDALDVCMHPGLHKTHGFLSSPDSVDFTHSLVPLFSQGKPSIFNDILFPSPYYAGRMDLEEYVGEEDPDWTEKSDTLSWSGATTGGYATLANWRTLHRQRLLLSSKSQPSVLVPLLNETSPGQWEPYMGPISDLQSLFNLKLTGTTQCEPEACEAERGAFGILPFHDGEENPNKNPMNLTYQSKYALDMDGNGISGRYYRLLKSRSAVIKQTIFKEWHDGRLVPWVQYVPLSMDADELPEIMRFLTQNEKGRVIGERIARESRSWANITLRKIDLQLSFLRLLLEYGRLMSDDRDTLNYEA